LTYDPVRFGAWLRRLRQAERLSSREVARRSGGLVHESTVTTVELGKQPFPSAKTIHGLALGIGVQTSYVMSKAGYGDEDGRWANFSRRERRVLENALAQFDPAYSELDAQAREEMLSEIKESYEQ
jgi:transcriptional regulator with XRE-family HTH domain